MGKSSILLGEGGDRDSGCADCDSAAGADLWHRAYRPIVGNSSRLPSTAAGRIEPEYIDEPDGGQSGARADHDNSHIDRSASVLSYLEEAGLDRDEAQKWAWFFHRAAGTDNLQNGHSLTLYKDPEDGSLRELKYNLTDRVAIREQTYGDGVIRSSQELITYVIRPVAVAFQVNGDSGRRPSATICRSRSSRL